MAEPINFLVVDLSHFDPAHDYGRVKAAGIVGVIYKATQGGNYQDPTYDQQRTAALKASLKWGAYHFGDGSDVARQVANFLGFAQIDPETLFCLDYEPNDSSQMSLAQAKDFIIQVEDGLGRPAECVLYSGNQIKEQLGSKKDVWWGSRRLWLAQYGTTPSVQASWKTYWLWQYTDGSSGPSPHTVAGCLSSGVDCNSYAGTSEELAVEWASGIPALAPVPSDLVVTVSISSPPGVTVKVLKT
jgi:lysozyme